MSMSDNHLIRSQMRRVMSRWMAWWYVVVWLYMARMVWSLREAPAVAVFLGGLFLWMLIWMFRIGLTWHKLLDLWDEEDLRKAQERRDEQTIKREEARLIEERQAAEIASVRADLEALHEELDT